MRTVNVIEAIYFAALEKKSPTERAAYLDEACKDDDALRRCVERMLNSAPKIGNFLQPDEPKTIEHAPMEERPGSVIGPYKILQQLGEGGFGVVFMAEQEQPVRRKVALKIIKPGMDSKQVIARFEAERQALAMMDHPNISRVLDGGTTESNRPYFVMELVKGMPITEFCDKNRLTPRERLELFVQVCNAVQHAHQKGVIHRDIKPSNVLVTMYDDKPVPKVIDFGVAKAIEQKLTEQTMFTRIGQVIGTLEYMSPEQASLNALDVDTRSDVYALGVLLYELLTGTTPLDKDRFQGVAFVEMLRLIREEEPPKPSTRLTQSGEGLAHIAAYRRSDSQKLPREVRGELDWITMKALEKDRTRRYNTASALAADVQHYLKDEHVEACPPTFAYRLQKYARKHKAFVGTMSAVTLILLIGIAATSWQAWRATNAETEALENLKDKETALLAEGKLRKIAEELKTKAIAESKAHQLAREELRRSHYAAALNLIPAAFQADNFRRMKELLEELKPKPGDADDLRGFEWHYWDRLAHPERRTVRLDENTNSPAFSGDGTRLAYVHVTDFATMGGYGVKIIDTASGKEVASVPVKKNTRDLAFNGDGRRLAVARGEPGLPAPNDENDIAVWDVVARKFIFAKKVAGLNKVGLSPDGKRLLAWRASGNARGDDLFPMGEPMAAMKIWDVDNPDREPVVLNHQVKQTHFALAFSPDGTRVAGVIWGPSRDGVAPRFDSQLVIWDAATGNVRAEATNPTTVFRIAFTPDGRQLVGVGRIGGPFGGFAKAISFESDPQTHVWDGADGAELKLVRATPLGRPSGSMTQPTFELSSDGLRMALWTPLSNAVRIVDTATGEPRQTIMSANSTWQARFVAGSTRLLTLEKSGTTILKEWTVEKEKPQAPPKVGFAQESIVWSADGKRQAVFRRNGKGGISIRDATGKEISTCPVQFGMVNNVQFSPNGKFFCVYSFGSVAKIFETETGKTRWSRDGLPFPQGGLAPGPVPTEFARHRFLVLPDAEEKEKIRIVNFDDLKERFSLSTVARFTFSPDGMRFFVQLSGHKDAPAALWDVEAARAIASLPPITLRPFPIEINAATFSEDSRLFATVNPGRKVTVWDAVTGKKRREMDESITTSPANMTFNRDGTRLAIVGTRGNSGLWSPSIYDVNTGKLVCRLEGHVSTVSSLAFSSDGKRVATFSFNLIGLLGKPTGDASSEVKLWDAGTGRELLSLSTSNMSGSRLSFSPDDQRLTLSGNLGQQTWDATPRDVNPAK